MDNNDVITKSNQSSNSNESFSGSIPLYFHRPLFELINDFVGDKQPTTAIKNLTSLLNEFIIKKEEAGFTDNFVCDTVCDTTKLIEFMAELNQQWVDFRNNNPKMVI